jgi:centromeric protein E
MGLLSPKTRKRTKSVDEMSKMLDEMIQDRVESGQLVKGVRGSVRIASERKHSVLVDPIPSMDLKSSMPLANEAPALVAEV